MRRLLSMMLLLLPFLALVACENRATVQGGANSNGQGGGRVHMGVPF